MGQVIIWAWYALVMLTLVNGWCCLICCCCYGCLEEERIGLLEIKAWINRPNGDSGALRDWVGYREGADCCEWNQVECDNTTKRVIKLDLSFARNYSLGDLYLNASLFLPFKELQSLDLSNNHLVGYYENQGFQVLTSPLRKLEDLELYDNKFNDSIVSALGGLISLKSLDLSYNMLTGVDGFKVLASTSTKLEELYLAANIFNDSGLSFLSGFSTLKSLDLSWNKLLTGSVDIKGLRNLEVLDLEGLSMTGSILLHSLKALPSLKTLQLEDNDLRAMVISQEVFNLVKLEQLFLDDSLLPPNFLQSIGALSALKVLSLSWCELNDSLPITGWCELKNLEYLDLQGNDLKGQLPPCLGNMTSLRSLYVSNNQLVGDIASTPISHLTLLESLSISSNHFGVSISLQPFMNFSNLKYFSCRDNKMIQERWTPQNLFPRFQLRHFTFSNSFSTEIPKFLHTQCELRSLDLSYNNFTGIFPSWIIQNNTRLEVVLMEGNSFTGALQWPSHAFPNLQAISVSDNEIHGQIPRNTCSIFPNLQDFLMLNNELAGSIPDCVGNMTSLALLDLSNNHLSSMGSVPQSSSLWMLKLSDNKLDGQISPSFFNFSTLAYLYLDGNNLQGQIWDFTVRPHPHFTVLDISNNNLTRMLPKWLGNLSYLKAADLSNNHFAGSIPTEFCKIDSLRFLGLSENHLSGTIPSCLDSLQYLRHVHLHKNQLSGQLKYAFANCSSLVTLDLRENNLTGPMPNLGNLSMLSVVLLRANNLEGVLSSQICLLKYLSILDLSQNKLSGPLLSCLGNLTFESDSSKSPGFYIAKDIYFQMYFYKLIIGDEVVEFTTKRHPYLYKGKVLNSMSGIDLSCNQFIGEIPPELGNLRGIHALNLSYNNLTGSIPVTFSNLKQIESLDLSYNNLIGGIPPQLDQLYSLSTFNVSYNNLSGRTPERKNQFGTFDESSYLGNPHLCGPPLQNSCGETESPPQPDVPTVDTEGDEGFIDMDAFYVTFGVCYVIVVLAIATILFINPYWRCRWFYFIEDCIDTCYYFVLDGFHKVSNFRRRH